MSQITATECNEPYQVDENGKIISSFCHGFPFELLHNVKLFFDISEKESLLAEEIENDSYVKDYFEDWYHLVNLSAEILKQQNSNFIEIFGTVATAKIQTKQGVVWNVILSGILKGLHIQEICSGIWDYAIFE